MHVTAGAGVNWDIVVHNIGAADARASQTGLTPTGGSEALIDTPAIPAGVTVTVHTMCAYGSAGDATAEPTPRTWSPRATRTTTARRAKRGRGSPVIASTSVQRVWAARRHPGR